MFESRSLMKSCFCKELYFLFTLVELDYIFQNFSNFPSGYLFGCVKLETGYGNERCFFYYDSY